MAYIGEIGKRITVTCKYTRKSSYVDYKFSYYGTTHFIHQFVDEADNVLVWKSTGIVNFKVGDHYGVVKEGSIVKLTGTVKEHSEYNGTKQTVFTRCKFEVVSMAKSKEEIDKEKRKEQMASIQDGDIIQTMVYRQYKEHYSDCETLAGSYRSFEHMESTIDVIIRAGRLKPSGVRGKRFYGFEITNVDTGRHSTYRAVCEENAMKQARREFPDWKGSELRCTKIYDYRYNNHRYF